MTEDQKITIGLIRALVKDSSEVITKELWKSWNNVLSFAEKQARADERAKVLSEVSRVIIDDLDTGEGNIFDENFRAELRAKLAEMKGGE